MTGAASARARLAALGTGVVALHLLALGHWAGAPRGPALPGTPALMRVALAPAPRGEADATPTPADPRVAGRPGPARAPADGPRAASGRTDAASTASTAPPQAPPSTALPSGPVTVPAPMRLRYEVAGSSRGLPVAGAGELAWRHDGERYEAQLEWTQGDGPGARRSLHSVGRLTAQGLAPERFSSRVRSEEAVHFDAAGGLITFSAGPAPATLAPGAQDRLAVLLQLAALLAGRPADFPPGRRIAVQVATAREAGLWHFEVEGEETLDLPGGAHRAVRLRHPPMHAYDPALEAWFAPGLAYAPVRVRLTLPGGDWLEHRWSGSDSARGRRASTWPGGELRAAGTP